MGAFAVACAIIGISNPVWHCDEPAALACELAVKETLDMAKSFERKEVVMLGPAQSRAPGVRVRYEYESKGANGPSLGVAECFFKTTFKPKCLQPNGIYDRCFNLSAVRLDGRFLSEWQIEQSAKERKKANVVDINRQDTKLVWVEPDPEPKPGQEPSPPSPAIAQPATPAQGNSPRKELPKGMFPVYEITDRGLEHYGADHQRADRLWQVASDDARQACAGRVKRGSDRRYEMLADCLSKQLARE